MRQSILHRCIRLGGIIVPLFLCAIFCSSCTEGGVRIATFDIHIPADAEFLQRTPGDPGGETSLAVPRHVYIMYMYEENGINHIQKVVYSDLEPDSWEVESDQYGIIRYVRSVSLSLPDAESVKAYVVVSNSPLDNVAAFVPDGEEDILNLQVARTLADGTQLDIENIYSGVGVIPVSDTRVLVDITCYHIAAKIDIMYNVSETFRATDEGKGWVVSSYTLTELPEKGYIFRPTENSYTGNSGPAYSYKPSAGNNIYGRFATYVFQRTDTRFPWQLTMSKVGETDRVCDYTSLLTTEQGEELSTEYATYFRLDVTINGINFE